MNEAISIIENLEAFGVKIPNTIKNRLLKLREDDKNENE
jgi:phage-related holin